MSGAAADMMGNVRAEPGLIQRLRAQIEKAPPERHFSGSHVATRAYPADAAAALDVIRRWSARMASGADRSVFGLGAEPLRLYQGRAEFLQPGTKGGLSG